MSKPLLALALCALAFIAHASALGNGFVWDDPIILARQLPVFGSVGAVFFPPENVPQFAPDYYRPLVIGSYLIDGALGGGAPWMFHLTVVLAHCLATLAVFGLGAALFGAAPPLPGARATLAAAIGAAGFAVHPIHTEAVAWVAGRADVFAGLFGTVAILYHLGSRRRPREAWVAGAALLLALLSKEVAISVALLAIAADILVPAAAPPAPAAAPPRAQRRRGAAAVAPPPRPGWRRYLPLGLALALYTGLRMSAISGGVTTRSGEVGGAWPPRMVAALGSYAGKLLAPVSFNAYIADEAPGAASLAAGAVVVAVFGAALWYALRRGWSVPAFLLVWIAVTLAPSLAILFKIPEVPLAERYLYLPSVGFCLLLGLGAGVGLAATRPLVRQATAALVAVAVFAGAAASAARTRVWASDLALWQDTAGKNPNAAMPLRSLGVALFQGGRLDEAARAYEEALRRHNSALGRATLYSNLGTIALTRGDLDTAERHYRDAVSAQSTADGLYNLALVALRRGEAARQAGDVAAAERQANAALEALNQAEGASPHDPDIPLAAGEALTLLGRDGEARARYERALALGLSGERGDAVRRRLQSP